MGSHNGNARILMTRIDVAGTVLPALQFNLPLPEVKVLIAALHKLNP